jgi:hypothetical protein
VEPDQGAPPGAGDHLDPLVFVPLVIYPLKVFQHVVGRPQGLEKDPLAVSELFVFNGVAGDLECDILVAEHLAGPCKELGDEPGGNPVVRVSKKGFRIGKGVDFRVQIADKIADPIFVVVLYVVQDCPGIDAAGFPFHIKSLRAFIKGGFAAGKISAKDHRRKSFTSYKMHLLSSEKSRSSVELSPCPFGSLRLPAAVRQSGQLLPEEGKTLSPDVEHLPAAALKTPFSSNATPGRPRPRSWSLAFR